MAKKKRKGRNTPKKKYSLPQLIQQASQMLDNGKYKEAIALYKQLLKRSDAETVQLQEWRDALAQAYSGRASQLAEKSMVQEALILWRQRAKSCDKALISAEYLGWLLHSGDHRHVFELYLHHQEALEKLQQLEEVRRRLAALMLGSKEGEAAAWLSQLDDNDPLKNGYAAAFEALQGFTSGDATTLQTALKKISFRSPYRDLRTIFKGEAHKITTDSPFHPLAQQLQLSTCDRFELLQALSEIDNKTLGWLSTLRGWSNQQQRMVTQWQLLSTAPKGKVILKFLATYQPLNPAYVQQASLALIVGDYGLKMQHENLFPPLDQQQTEWLAAIEAEKQRYHPRKIEAYWHDYLYELPPGEEHNLERALVLNRIIALAEQHLNNLPDYLCNREPKKLVAKTLQQALEYDGSDLNGWCKLIRWQRELDQLKEARLSIESALHHFPQSTRVLEEAAETAISSGAHKKAARYAKQILELDPVNLRVKRLLFVSHHTHARKQLKKNMYSHCEKELELAAAWASGEDQLGRLALARANLCLQLKKPYTEHLQQAREQLGDGVSLRYMLQQEHYSDYPLSLPAAESVASVDDLLMLSRLIDEHIEQWNRNTQGKNGVWRQQNSPFESMLSPFQTILQQAAQLPQLTQQQLLNLCAFWLRDEMKPFNLAPHYAEAGLERWPDHLLMRCYWLIAEDEQGDQLDDYDMVEQLLKQAREEKDERVVHLLLENFDLMHDMDYFPEVPPWDELDGESMDGEPMDGDSMDYEPMDDDSLEGSIDDLFPPDIVNTLGTLLDDIPLGELISKASSSLPYAEQRVFKQMLAEMRGDTNEDNVQLKALLLGMLENEGKSIIERILAGAPWKG